MSDSLIHIERSNKTKKNKHKTNKNKDIWNLFNNEIKNTKTIECLYDSKKREFCDISIAIYFIMKKDF